MHTFLCPKLDVGHAASPGQSQISRRPCLYTCPASCAHPWRAMGVAHVACGCSGGCALVWLKARLCAQCRAVQLWRAWWALGLGWGFPVGLRVPAHGCNCGLPQVCVIACCRSSFFVCKYLYRRQWVHSVFMPVTHAPPSAGFDCAMHLHTPSSARRVRARL